MGRSLLQDKAGNFWFCTINEGVYCYDGKAFTNFTEEDGLSSNFVWSVVEDEAGMLWFGTADGVTCYDPSAEPGTKKFTTLPITSIKGSHLHNKTAVDAYGVPYPDENFVWTVSQDNTGIYWLGTSDGVYRYDPSAESGRGAGPFSHFTHDDGIVNKTGVPIQGIESILEDSAGNIWLGGRSSQGVFRFDGNTLTNIKLEGEYWVRPLLADKAGNVWFGCPKGHMIYRYDGKSFTSVGDKEITDWVFYMAEDGAGNLWFSNGENGGVTRYDGISCINFTAQDGLCYDMIWSLAADKAGNIWFENRNRSLCRYDGRTFTGFSE